MKLFLEPDTEPLENTDDEVIQSSQKQEVDQSISERSTPVLAKRLEALGKHFDLSTLNNTLAKKPTLARTAFESDNIILEDKEDKKDMDSFFQRFMKHAKADGKMPALKGRKKNVDITIVSKETDKQGHEMLKSQTIKYKVDLSNVAKVKNVDRPGAQLLALKKTLKDKILEKKRAERAQRAELNAEDNEDILEDEDEFDEENETEDEMEDEDQEESSEGKLNYAR